MLSWHRSMLFSLVHSPVPPYRGHPIKIWGYTADTHLAAYPILRAITRKLALHPNAPIPRAAEAHEEEVLLFRDGGPFTAISRYTLCGNFLTSLRKSGLDIREIFNNIRSFVANIWQIRTRSSFRPIISPTLFPFLFLRAYSPMFSIRENRSSRD